MGSSGPARDWHRDRRRATLARMSRTSDRAELSSLRALVVDLGTRVVTVADRYDDTADSAIATDLYAAEQALRNAARSLERALAAMEEPGRA